MTITDADRAANDERIARDIAHHGCHVISVFDPEEKLPVFAYTIGVTESAGAPEAIVFGLSRNLGHSLLNEYCRRARAGERFARGTKVGGFLEGFPVLFEPVRASRHAEYTLGCARRYGRLSLEYAVVQVVWPSTRGVWPWEKAASEWLVANQPLLGRKRPDRV